jgi:dTDP-4-dehydrorhamnose reductase
MQKINPAHSIIIRTSWVYSSYGNNFVKSMLSLAREKKELTIVSDQLGSPTYAGDLAKTILEILPKIKNEKVAVYHYSNEGECSWYNFAGAIFKIKDIPCSVKPITTKQYPTAAKRPFYSLLNKDKIKKTFELNIPDWRDSLGSCLQKIECKKQ